MSTKKTSTTDLKFDPQSMGRYQTAQNALLGPAQGMWQNPYNNPEYLMNLARNYETARQLGGRNMQNSLAALGGMGFGGPDSGLRAATLARAGRFGSRLQYQGFLGAGATAEANRWNAAQVLGGMQPLRTGEKSVQKTSGLGTWLPQLAGAAIGAFVGGVPGLMGGMKGFGGGGGGGMTGFQNAAGGGNFGAGAFSGYNFGGGGGNSFWSPGGTSNYQFNRPNNAWFGGGR